MSTLMYANRIYQVMILKKIKERFDMFTYTKKWTTIIIICCITWVFLAFFIALFGKEEIGKQLGSDVLGLIKTIFCAYLVRAFFDSYAEHKYRLKVFCEKCRYDKDICEKNSGIIREEYDCGIEDFRY